MVYATSAFDLKKDETLIAASFCLKSVKNGDEASVLLWNWILKHIKLCSKNAAIHKIYQNDTAGFFYDLNEDGTREILGTHYATSLSGMGDCLLYILKFNTEEDKKYSLISKDLYFDAQNNINILQEKTDGYHNIMVSSINSEKPIVLTYDKSKKSYVEKR